MSYVRTYEFVFNEPTNEWTASITRHFCRASLQLLYNYCASFYNEEIDLDFHLIFTVTKFAICIHLPFTAVRSCAAKRVPQDNNDYVPLSPPFPGFPSPGSPILSSLSLVRSKQGSATIATTISYQLPARAVHARARMGLANW